MCICEYNQMFCTFDKDFIRYGLNPSPYCFTVCFQIPYLQDLKCINITEHLAG